MYFCIHKIKKNEQNILLEMRNTACLHFRNDTLGYGIVFYNFILLIRLMYSIIAGSILLSLLHAVIPERNVR